MSAMARSKLSDADVESAWNKIQTLADNLAEWLGREDGFSIEAGSPLTGDDKHSSPHHVSHAVRTEITAAVDHLHALSVLVCTSGFLHLAAPATLARGALETASTAIWIMSPRGRDERITRALKWTVLDIKDSDRAAIDAGVPITTPLQDRLDKVEIVAVRRGLDFRQIKRGYKSTEAVAAAEAHTNSSFGVVLPWRLCSGSAHGRRWPQLVLMELEKHPTVDPRVTNVKLENDFGRLLSIAIPAAHTVSDAVELFDQKARKPWACPWVEAWSGSLVDGMPHGS
jgi:hypothetical protein